MNKRIYRLFSLASLLLPGMAIGHGWVDYPKARQTICAEDGGYWSSSDGSSIPNDACRAAFLESGTYPFVQKNEFAANVEDYLDQSAVEALVNDGQLCSAGSTAKSGMDIPSAVWQKTLLSAGTHRLKFRATAPHNPSFWRIYLSKVGFDSASERLSWSDLELINRYDDLPVENGFYEMDISIPEDRSGSGILFVRWQRNDSAGEGFYNCSDIAFTEDSVSPPPTDPTPDPAPEFVAIGNYVSTAHDIAESGDTVRFRLFNADGNEVIDQRVLLNDTNAAFSLWSRELAFKVNDQHRDIAFIGVWNEAMQHLMYDKDNAFSNRVWALDNNYTFSTSVIKAGDPSLPEPDYEFVYPEGKGSYQEGTLVLGADNQVYECKPFPNSGWCNQSSLHYAPGAGLSWQDAWSRQ